MLHSGHVYCQTFQPSEYMKKIRVPIVNDDQYTADKDFYVFLKNPSANASVGDPSVTRVTIIDDDGASRSPITTSRCC